LYANLAGNTSLNQTPAATKTSLGRSPATGLLAWPGGLQNHLRLHSIFYPTWPKNWFQTQKSRHLTGHGAGVAGKTNFIFAQLCQRNQPQLNEGTMPFLFKKSNLNPAHDCGSVGGVVCRHKRTQWCAVTQRHPVCRSAYSSNNRRIIF
jgi:hypothetical protein